MKFTLSKFPNNDGVETWQVLCGGNALCRETDEQTASALAREYLHKKVAGNEAQNELWFWDYYNKSETLMDKS